MSFNYHKDFYAMLARGWDNQTHSSSDAQRVDSTMLWPDRVWTVVRVDGWIHHIRSSGKITFVELRDGQWYVQCIGEKNTLWEAMFATLSGLWMESSVMLIGTVQQHPKKDERELSISHVEVYQATLNYPLGTKDDHGPEFLFDNRHLYLRSKKQRAIQRVRDRIIFATYTWMHEYGFTKIDAPIFTPSACEGTTELYSVEHVNGETMYLSQSWQLYLEAAMYSVGRCFDFGPVFRAEKSKTRRHLNEFWMMDAEIPYIQQEENMIIQEALMKYIINELLIHHKEDFSVLQRDTAPLEHIISKPRPRMTHQEFVRDLQRHWFDVHQGDDIGSDIEMQYMAKVDLPIFVTHFPMGIKAFYTKEDPAMPGYALCSDLLAPEWCGEIIGSSTRDDDYGVLLQKIHEHHLDPALFDWYLDLRMYGSVPHAGFGYGLERIVRWTCGLHHIRETIPFPRYAKRITP
jgi:asparaginyl-tRNA synthetase